MRGGEGFVERVAGHQQPPEQWADMQLTHGGEVGTGAQVAAGGAALDDLRHLLAAAGDEGGAEVGRQLRVVSEGGDEAADRAVGDGAGRTGG